MGNGYLLLKLRTKLTNQRRNPILKTSTRTKLAKPKTASTMVILVAFYILLTHICSYHYLLPSGQTRRSNAFSPWQEPPFAGRQKSEFRNAGCWHTTHIISTNFSSNHRRNHPRKHVRFKSTMPTSRNLLIPSILTTSGNVLPTSITGAGATALGGSDEDNFNGFINFQPF